MGNLNNLPLMRILTVHKVKRKKQEIIMWWELRRILYNMAIIPAVFIGLKILDIDIDTVEIGSGEHFLLILFVGYVVFFNLFYTSGWIIELCSKRSLTFGPFYFKTYLFVSLLCLAMFDSIVYYVLNNSF